MNDANLLLKKPAGFRNLKKISVDSKELHSDPVKQHQQHSKTKSLGTPNLKLSFVNLTTEQYYPGIRSTRPTLAASSPRDTAYSAERNKTESIFEAYKQTCLTMRTTQQASTNSHSLTKFEYRNHKDSKTQRGSQSIFQSTQNLVCVKRDRLAGLNSPAQQANQFTSILSGLNQAPASDRNPARSPLPQLQISSFNRLPDEETSNNHKTKHAFTKKIYRFEKGAVEIIEKHKPDPIVQTRRGKAQLMINISNSRSGREYEFQIGKEKNKYDTQEHHSIDQPSEDIVKDKYKFERVFEVVRQVWLDLNEIARMFFYSKPSFQSHVSRILEQSRSTQGPNALIPVFNFYKETEALKSSPRLKLSFLMASLFSGGKEAEMHKLLSTMLEGYMSGREDLIIGENVRTYLDQMQLTSKLDLVLAFELERFAAALRTFLVRRKLRSAQKDANSLREKFNSIENWEGKEYHILTKNPKKEPTKVRVELLSQLDQNQNVLELLQKVEEKTKSKFGISKEHRGLNKENWGLLAKIKEAIKNKRTSKKPFIVLKGPEFFLSDEYQAPIM